MACKKPGTKLSGTLPPGVSPGAFPCPSSTRIPPESHSLPVSFDDGVFYGKAPPVSITGEAKGSGPTGRPRGQTPKSAEGSDPNGTEGSDPNGTYLRRRR